MNINNTPPRDPNTQRRTADPQLMQEPATQAKNVGRPARAVKDPDAVRHIMYTQPRHGKRQKRSLLFLMLALFLCFSLSLLGVYFIATAIKNSRAHQHGNTVVSDAIGTSDSQTEVVTEAQTEAETETEATVYASVTPDTVLISEDEIKSQNAILISLSDFTVLAQRNGDTRIYPASMTKIMTLLVAVEHISDLNATTSMTKETASYCYLEGASVAGFGIGEVITVKDLLYGTILPSGADATRTLAEYVAGTEEGFAVLMNEKAAQLGLNGTHFVNSSGLHDPNHYSTPHDIAMILRAALSDPTCFRILSAEKYVTSKTAEHPNGIPLSSIVHTRTSSAVLKGITLVGGKTGYTPEAGQCLATYAITDNGQEYILVTSGAPDKASPVSDAKHLYETYVTAEKIPADSGIAA